jgi:hypothetical protein
MPNYNNSSQLPVKKDFHVGSRPHKGGLANEKNNKQPRYRENFVKGVVHGETETTTKRIEESMRQHRKAAP